MIDKDTLKSQGGIGKNPWLEDKEFFKCLKRAKDHVKEEEAQECFERALELSDVEMI